MSAGSAVDRSLLASRAFQRLLAASALGHLVLALGLVVQNWRPLPDLDEAHVVYVSELPAAALPAPSPAKPAPARQQVEEIVIPDKPRPKPRPPQAKPVPAKPEPRPVESKPAPEPEPQAKPSPTASALLDKLRDEAKARQPKGVPEGSPEGKGEVAGILDSEKAEYARRVRSAIEPHWISSACERQRTAPRWIVEITGGGATSDVSLGRSSGDRFCDDSAERAILKATLPAPPRGIRVIDINFEELR